MIFGPDGKSIQKSGDSYFTDEGYVHKSGSMYFGPNGQSATESGGMIFTNQGTITQPSHKAPHKNIISNNAPIPIAAISAIAALLDNSIGFSSELFQGIRGVA